MATFHETYYFLITNSVLIGGILQSSYQCLSGYRVFGPLFHIYCCFLTVGMFVVFCLFSVRDRVLILSLCCTCVPVLAV